MRLPIPQLHGRNDHKRLSHWILVGNGNVDMGFESARNNGLEAEKRRAGEPHRGPSGRQIYHREVAKEDAVSKPGSESLGAGFLGGEALCIGRGAVGTAFGQLPFG